MTSVHLLGMFTINEQWNDVNIMDRFIGNDEEDILQGENESESKLVIDMVTSGSFYYDEQYEEIKTQIEKLKEGFADSTRNIRK